MKLSNMPKNVDTLVIGGGTAGSIIAGRLASKENQHVVLLEAGPDFGPSNNKTWPADLLNGTVIGETHDWGYKSSSKNGEPNHNLERAKVIGGCSSHNGCIAIWGSYVDYDTWESYGNQGWSAKEVLPYFNKANKTLGVRDFKKSEVTPFHSACVTSIEKIGIPSANNLNDLYEDYGVGISPVNNLHGQRFNAAFGYLDPVRGNGYLSIVGDALVDKINLRGNRACSVDAIINKKRINITADRIIISGGAYESPCILMRSGIGSSSNLSHLGIKTQINLNGVGENLHDHPSINIKFQGTDLLSSLMREFRQNGNVVYSEQTIAKTQSKNCKEGFDLHLYPVTEITENSNGKWDCAIYAANMAPISRGHLALNSADPIERPIIDQGYLNDSEDKDIGILMEGLELIREISHQKVISELIGDELFETSKIVSRDDIRKSALHYYHPVGTCKMGPESDSNAVVDNMGKIHGVDNLYVIDASIMPNVPRGNTNMPVAMVAERLVSKLT
tara:strand:- start:25596 stop:27107 length:1512 start_codon:yes stop_codon:yes gene_type:complete